MMAETDAKGELLALDAVSNAFRAVTEITVYTPDHPGCLPKSPAPSRRRAARSSTPSVHHV